MFSRLSFKALLVSALCSASTLSLAALRMETIACLLYTSDAADED